MKKTNNVYARVTTRTLIATVRHCFDPGTTCDDCPLYVLYPDCMINDIVIELAARTEALARYSGERKENT